MICCTFVQEFNYFKARTYNIDGLKIFSKLNKLSRVVSLVSFLLNYVKYDLEKHDFKVILHLFVMSVRNNKILIESTQILANILSKLLNDRLDCKILRHVH